MVSHRPASLQDIFSLVAGQLKGEAMASCWPHCSWAPSGQCDPPHLCIHKEAARTAGRRSESIPPGHLSCQAHCTQLFLSGCSLRPTAAGHRLQDPQRYLGQHISTAMVDGRCQGRWPGCRVRRPGPGDRGQLRGRIPALGAWDHFLCAHPSPNPLL